MSKPTRAVLQYFESLGLRDFRNQEKFWSYMERSHGEGVCREIDAAFEALSENDLESFYKRIYQDLDISLKLGSLRRNLYCGFASWFISFFQTFDGVLLDVGCGNGILTCFLAQKYSSAKVVGIDRLPEGIICARALAERLGLENVEFLVADCASLDSLSEREFDVVLSMTGLDAAKLELGERRTENLLEWAASVEKEIVAPAMVTVAKVLKPTGKFISVDRLPNCESQFGWSAGIQNAGLGIDLVQTTELSFEDLGTKETLPIIVASPDAPRLGYCELLSFWVEKQGGLEQLSVGDSRDALSELLFFAINPKQLIQGWKVVFRDGSGIASYEIWQSGVLLLLYTHTTNGYRELKVAPAYELATQLRSLEKQMDKLRHGASVTAYESEAVPVLGLLPGQIR